jgi:hypothetical protein
MAVIHGKGPLSPRYDASAGCGWRVGANILDISRGQPKGDGSRALVRREANNPSPYIYKHVTKYHKGPRNWSDSLDKQRTLRKMVMRFVTWKLRNLYTAGSLMTVTKELSNII